ncbi:MAG: hypothetical protein V1737_03110 [Chloroflexota bacterium]
MTNQTNRRLFHVLGSLATVIGALLNSRSTAVTILDLLALLLVAAELLRRTSSGGHGASRLAPLTLARL